MGGTPDVYVGDAQGTPDFSTGDSEFLSEAEASARFATLAALATKAADGSVVHLAGTEVITGAKEFQAAVTLTDVNLVLSATTGTKIGTATTQKLGFYNATPVVQPAGTVDVLASLVTLGLRAASSNPPLNLGTGTVTAGQLSIGSAQLTNPASTQFQTNGALFVGTELRSGNGQTYQARLIDGGDFPSWLITANRMGFGDGIALTFGTTNGTKICNATTQKIGFWNATPVVQPTAVADASAGAIIDAEARTALNALLARMRTVGLIAT